MAEVTAFRNNALPYPVYGVPWTVVFPVLDVDGDPVTGLTCDSEVSKNGDTAVDCTNEGTEIPFTTATNKGMYYLTLTAAEMTADIVAVTVYTGSADAQATCLVFYPRKLVSLATGTSQGGAVGYITLAAATLTVNAQYSGCLCVATIDAAIEARVLQVCTQADQQCTVTPAWNVAPDADDTYIIYLPEGRQLPTSDVSAWTHVATVAGAIPAAAAGAAGGLPVSDAGGLDIDTLLAYLDAAITSRNATVPDAAGVAAGLHGVTDGLIAGLVVPDAAGIAAGLHGVTDGLIAGLVVPDAAGTAAGLHGVTDGLIGGLVVPDAAGTAAALHVATNILINALVVPDAAGTAAALHVATDALIAALVVPDAAGTAAALHVATNALIAAIAGGDATAANQTTLLARLTAVRATLLDNLSNLDVLLSSRATPAQVQTTVTVP